MILLASLALWALAGWPAVAAARELTISIVGTSDLHGHVEPTPIQVKDRAGHWQPASRGGLPLLGGYVENLRRKNPVILLDAGDLFQGTLTSNLAEGQVVIEAYNVLRYAAAAVGNHEFDYGPAGPRSVPKIGSDDDPVGALKARIAAAHFPFLTANIIDDKTGKPIDWPNVYPARLIKLPEQPALLVGVIGATAEDTPRTTNSANLRGLTVGQVVPAVKEQAQALRKQGAQLILLTVHEGANCKSFDNPRDLSACQNDDGRVVKMAEALQGDVDAIVAGHTHAAMAHFVGSIPVIQSYSGGRAFGRIDLSFRAAGQHLTLAPDKTRIFPPTEVCSVTIPETHAAAAGEPRKEGPDGKDKAKDNDAGPGPRPGCDPRVLNGTELSPVVYEGRPVKPSAAVAAAIAPFVEKAKALRAEPLGITLKEKLSRRYRDESPLGQVLADLIREGASLTLGKPVDFAFQNGGGIRADLSAGALTYGDIFEIVPFDNRLAVVQMTGKALSDLFAANLAGGAGILEPSAGLVVDAKCVAGSIQVTLSDSAGKPLLPDRTYSVAVSDFLAGGGDNFGAVLGKLPKGAVTFYEDAPTLRDIMVRALKEHHELPLPPAGTARLHLPMPRPVRCPASPSVP